MANKLLISKNTDQYNEILHDLSMMSNTLLVDLNEIVLQYQKEGEEKIAVIQNLELIAWIITLLTLLIEVIFIFQPMANTLRTLFQKEMWNKNYLEQEIQIRTYSLEQANEKLQYSASHDPLTGLNNRLNLEHELESLISHYRENRIPFAVLMLDIDWFKKVNDNYGHDIGDFVLKELATLIRGAIRSEDSAYRAGGEEFVIILNRISQVQAIEKAEALRHSIEEHSFVLGEVELRITISGGLYHPKWVEATDLHDVLKLSDNSLYEAKHLGRNRIVSVHGYQS
ncbi:GGDEF domain-containing protein [bacterium]|nr:GGDEF domain-containing protein [bacterium]